MLGESGQTSYYKTQFVSQKLKPEQVNEFQMPRSHPPFPSTSHSDTGGMIANARAFSKDRIH